MSDPYYGEIKMIGFYYPPLDYAFCNGQQLKVEQNGALYSLLGIQYGGDGRVYFKLPDFRGRVPIHSANGDPGPKLSSYRLGQAGGLEYSNLTVEQMPVHNHTATPKDASVRVHCQNGKGDQSTPEGNFWAQGQSGMNDVTNGYTSTPDSQMNNNAVTIEGLIIDVGDTGGTDPYSRLQPYLAVNFVIALAGTYPPRN